MQTAYALHDTDNGPVLMVFTSRASRDAFCVRTLFTGNRARRISGYARFFLPPHLFFNPFGNGCRCCHGLVAGPLVNREGAEGSVYHILTRISQWPIPISCAPLP